MERWKDRDSTRNFFRDSLHSQQWEEEGMGGRGGGIEGEKQRVGKREGWSREGRSDIEKYVTAVLLSPPWYAEQAHASQDVTKTTVCTQQLHKVAIAAYLGLEQNLDYFASASRAHSALATDSHWVV